MSQAHRLGFSHGYAGQVVRSPYRIATTHHQDYLRGYLEGAEGRRTQEDILISKVEAKPPDFQRQDHYMPRMLHEPRNRRKGKKNE